MWRSFRFQSQSGQLYPQSGSPDGCLIELTDKLRTILGKRDTPKAFKIYWKKLFSITDVLKRKISVWTGPPFIFIGKVNLFKIIFLSKFLYLLFNSPCIWSKSYFKKFNNFPFSLFGVPSLLDSAYLLRSFCSFRMAWICQIFRGITILLSWFKYIGGYFHSHWGHSGVIIWNANEPCS